VDIAFSILLTFILVLINGYFSMSEMALISARRTALQQEADEGDKKAQAALDISANSDRLLSAIQIFITLVGFGAAAAATNTLSEPLALWLSGFGLAWLSTIASVLAVVLVTLFVSYITLIFGELLPKRIALSDAENVSKKVAHSLAFAEKVAAPIVVLLAHSTNGVAKLLGIKSSEDRQAISEDDIKYLVSEQDTLLDEEKRMIHEIFDLGDTIAREVMVPRVDLKLIEDDATVRETIEHMRGTGCSRLPVFHESPDRIIGVAMVKDLLVPLMDGKDGALITDYMRDPVFIPDTKDLLPLLGEMQTSHQRMVIVVDEYGGTAGIITVEDIVEEIVGELADEYDPDNKFLTQLSDREWLVDGRFPIDDSLELGWPVRESEDYETIAGWLLDTIDYVPRVNDEFTIGGYVFKVQSMRRRRVALIRVSAPESLGVSASDMLLDETGAVLDGKSAHANR
jgi:putative hemolysin